MLPGGHWSDRRTEGELLSRKGQYLEGDWRGDGGLVYRTRATMCAGWLSAGELSKRLSDPQHELDDAVESLVRELLPHLFIWGESAVPAVLLVGMLLRERGDGKAAREIWSSALTAILGTNQPGQGSAAQIPMHRRTRSLRCVAESRMQTSECIDRAAMPIPLWRCLSASFGMAGGRPLPLSGQRSPASITQNSNRRSSGRASCGARRVVSHATGVARTPKAGGSCAQAQLTRLHTCRI